MWILGFTGLKRESLTNIRNPVTRTLKGNMKGNYNNEEITGSRVKNIKSPHRRDLVIIKVPTTGRLPLSNPWPLPSLHPLPG